MKVLAPLDDTTRFTATARRDLDKLPPRIRAAVIEFAFGDLAQHPRRVGKPMGGELAGHHSARRGPYRLLYRIDDATKTIWVHRVVSDPERVDSKGRP
jgi:mRNA interferase RelE/StbE